MKAEADCVRKGGWRGRGCPADSDCARRPQNGATRVPIPPNCSRQCPHVPRMCQTVSRRPWGEAKGVRIPPEFPGHPQNFKNPIWSPHQADTGLLSLALASRIPQVEAFCAGAQVKILGKPFRSQRTLSAHYSLQEIGVPSSSSFLLVGVAGAGS